MSGLARQLPMHELRPGMALAADLCDAHGQALLKAGMVLGAGHIEALRGRGLSGAWVDVPDPDAPADEARRAAARLRLERLFRHARPEDEWFRALIEAYRLAPRP